MAEFAAIPREINERDEHMDPFFASAFLVLICLSVRESLGRNFF